MKKITIGALLSAALLWTLPAQAAVFHFSYSGTGVSGSGDFISADIGSPYEITNVTGFANGDAITGISTWGSADNLLWYPAAAAQVGNPPSGYNEALPTYVSFWGISFATSTNTWNLANYNGYLVAALNFLPNDPGIVQGYVRLDNLTVQLSENAPPQATPLPGALVLFGSALGLAAVAVRRRKKVC